MIGLLKVFKDHTINYFRRECRQTFVLSRSVASIRRDYHHMFMHGFYDFFAKFFAVYGRCGGVEPQNPYLRDSSDVL